MWRSLQIVLSGLVAALLIGACGDEDETSGATELRVIGIDSGAVLHDLGKQGPSLGDFTVFRDDLEFVDGGDAGRLYGTATVVKVIGDRDVRQVAITFDLPEGQIVIGGVSGSPAGETATISGQEFVRPIVGGSGAYVGATGEISTVQNADGTAEHLIRVEGS